MIFVIKLSYIQSFISSKEAPSMYWLFCLSFFVMSVIESFKLGSTPLVLTERVEHLNILSNMLSAYTDKIVVLKGGMKNNKRNLALDIIKSFSKERFSPFIN